MEGAGKRGQGSATLAGSKKVNISAFLLTRMSSGSGGDPASNGDMQNGSSVRTRTSRAHVFARFGADLHAQSAISNKNFCIGTQAEVY